MTKKTRKKERNTTIDDLAVMMAGGFSRVDEKFSRVDKRFDQVYEDMKVLRTDIDIMLSHHIGTFRRDYDDLAARVKKIEETLFQRR